MMDDVFAALQAELDRAHGMVLPGSQPPEFVGFTLLEDVHSSVEASLGGLVRTDLRRNRTLHATVRVGDHTVDSANFETMPFLGDDHSASLPERGSPTSIRQIAWLLADGAYKDAVENLGRKLAAHGGREATERPVAFAPGPVQTALLDAAPPENGAPLEPLARSLSALFLGHPEIRSSSVYASAEGGRMVVLDSLGTRIQKPQAEVDLVVVATASAPDGRRVEDRLSWIVRRIEDLPSLDAASAEVRALIDRLDAWEAATPATSAWSGPVVFEDEAAVQFFQTLLVPSLRGTPAPERDSRTSFLMSESGPASARLGDPLLPRGWRVDDDPLRDPALPSSYAYDDEGEAAQAVTLVDDGNVVSLLCSRTPALGISASNGHGRALFDRDVVPGEPAQLRVAAPGAKTRARMEKAALRLAASERQDGILVVRRLATPAPTDSLLHLLGGGDGPGVTLPAPLEAVRVHADGREERVRGYVFKATDPDALAQIRVAGPQVERTRLSVGKTDFRMHSPTYGLPVTLQVPEVVVDGLRLVPDPSPRDPAPLVPSPIAASAELELDVSELGAEVEGVAGECDTTNNADVWEGEVCP